MDSLLMSPRIFGIVDAIIDVGGVVSMGYP